MGPPDSSSENQENTSGLHAQNLTIEVPIGSIQVKRQSYLNTGGTHEHMSVYPAITKNQSFFSKELCIQQLVQRALAGSKTI